MEKLDGITFKGKTLREIILEMEEKNRMRVANIVKPEVEPDKIYPYRKRIFKYPYKPEPHGEVKRMSQKHINAENYESNMKKATNNTRLSIIAILLSDDTQRFTINSLATIIVTNTPGVKSAMARLVHKTVLGNYIQRERRVIGTISRYDYWMNDAGLELTWDEAVKKSMQLVDNNGTKKSSLIQIPLTGSLEDHRLEPPGKELKSIKITTTTVGDTSTQTVKLIF
jgi:hypothetical protein